MAVVQYLPVASVNHLVKFALYTGTSGIAQLGTDLNAAFGATAGNIQVSADTTTGHTTNALVVSNDAVLIAVVAGNYVTYLNGAWLQLTPTQLAAQYLQYYTT